MRRPGRRELLGDLVESYEGLVAALRDLAAFLLLLLRHGLLIDLRELAGEGRVILLRHRAVGEASDGLFEFEGRYVCSGTVEPLERQPETAAVGG